jgi:hypothetical protein
MCPQCSARQVTRHCAIELTLQEALKSRIDLVVFDKNVFFPWGLAN